MATFNSKETVFFKDDLVMSREYGVNHQNNEPYDGQWVVRNRVTGEHLANSRYSNDLVDKYGFTRD